QAVLTEPLIAGQCYYLEMFTSPGLNLDTIIPGQVHICYAVSHVGMYLSQDPPLQPPGPFYIIDVTPQVYYNFVVNDTLGWTRLSGTYIAEGDEQYITIGNFFQPGEFMEEIFPDCNLSPHAYYYIEDVKVEPIYNDEI